MEIQIYDQTTDVIKVFEAKLDAKNGVISNVVYLFDEPDISIVPGEEASYGEIIVDEKFVNINVEINTKNYTYEITEEELKELHNKLAIAGISIENKAKPKM